MAKWSYTVDVSKVWRDKSLSFEERRDQVVGVLRASDWYNSSTYLKLIVQDLEETGDVEEFDDVWCQIYDLADEERAWIKTWV